MNRIAFHAPVRRARSMAVGLAGFVLALVLSAPAFAAFFVANAGPDQTAVVGQQVSLTGTEEFGVYGSLTFGWSFVETPAGSAATLSGADTATPSFVADRPGVYVVGLDLGTEEDPETTSFDTVTITVITAQALAEQQIAEVLEIIAALPDGAFNAPGHENALANFLQQAVAALQAEDPALAIAKLEMAMNRTDGYPLRGALDNAGSGKDWVVDEAAQQAIYPLLVEARASLTP